jgi:hypothetical protein
VTGPNGRRHDVRANESRPASDQHAHDQEMQLGIGW